MKICDAIDRTFEFSPLLSWWKTLGISNNMFSYFFILAHFFSFSYVAFCCCCCFFALVWITFSYPSYFFMVIRCSWHQIWLISAVPSSSHHPTNGPSWPKGDCVLAAHPNPCVCHHPSSKSVFSKPSKSITSSLVHYSFLFDVCQPESMDIQSLKY